MSKSEKYVRASDCEKYFYNHLDDNEMISAMNAIEEMPAADVAPVKHGHWERVDDTKCKCSECEAIAMIAQYPPGADKHFCPNCGANMTDDTTAEKLFTILNCPECGGEVNIRVMDFADNNGLAFALFECKKCHKCINVTTEYKNNPRTAVSLAWNEYVVRQEAHKAVKYASEEMARKGVPVDCVKCRFYNRQFEICRKKNEKVLPFCFCYDGEEREYHVKVTTDNPNLSDAISEMISEMPEYVQQRYAEYWHNKIFSDRKEREDNNGQGKDD